MKMIDVDRCYFDNADAPRLTHNAIAKVVPPFDIWTATVEEQSKQTTNGFIHIRHTIFREVDEWRVTTIATVKSPNFVAVVSEWASWDFDPKLPFPYKSYNDPRSRTGSIWDEITGDDSMIAVGGSLAHFIAFAGLKGQEAHKLIAKAAQCGKIDALDKKLALLAIGDNEQN